jgi:hypothetical protein
MLVKAARRRLRIVDVEVPYRPRLGGQSKVAGNVRGSLGAATTLLRCAVTYSGTPRWAMAHGR